MKQKVKTRLRLDQKGFAIWLVAVVGSFIFLGMLWITTLMQGEISQLTRFERLLRTDMAGRACYQEFAATLRVTPWDNRPTLQGPYVNHGREFNGVTVSLLAEDVKAMDHMVDVWVHASCDGVVRSFLNRVEVRPSLVQKMNELRQVHFSFLDPEVKQGEADVRQQVETVLALRDEKRQALDVATTQLQSGTSLEETLGALGMDAGGVVSKPSTVKNTVSLAMISPAALALEAGGDRPQLTALPISRMAMTSRSLADIDPDVAQELTAQAATSAGNSSVTAPPVEQIPPPPAQSLAELNQAAIQFIARNRELLDYVMKNYPEAVEMVKKHPERVAAYLENRNINLWQYIEVYEKRRTSGAVASSDGGGGDSGDGGSSATQIGAGKNGVSGQPFNLHGPGHQGGGVVGSGHPGHSGQGHHGNGHSGQGHHGNGHSGQGHHGNGNSGQGQHGNGRSGQGQHGNGRSGQSQHGNGNSGQGSHGGGHSGQGQHGGGH